MQRPELSQLIPALNADGFLTRLVPASDEVPVDQLMALLDDEDEALTWRLEMMVLPEVNEPTIVQFFVPLSFSVSEAVMPDLARFVLMLNNVLALTGFGMDEANGWVYYRHMMACRYEEELDVRLAMETVWMIGYQLDRFAPLINDVAMGAKTLAEGARALVDNLESWRPGEYDGDGLGVNAADE